MDDATDRILAAVHAVPRGAVAAYGEIARRAGLPRRARWVARVLARDTDPALPWHRIVRADGRIAFPAGSEQFQEQARRLIDEGVCLRDGRVLRTADDDLDAALWAPR
ncbi:MGMT family protein [Cognatilysobacter bugurensis]|nr:MGMT family protein [Lysobacter bugurensis]